MAYTPDSKSGPERDESSNLSGATKVNMDDFLDINVENEKCSEGGLHNILYVDDHNFNVMHMFCSKCKIHGSSVCGAICCWGEKLTDDEFAQAMRNAKKYEDNYA